MFSHLLRLAGRHWPVAGGGSLFVCYSQTMGISGKYVLTLSFFSRFFYVCRSSVFCVGTARQLSLGEPDLSNGFQRSLQGTNPVHWGALPPFRVFASAQACATKKICIGDVEFFASAEPGNGLYLVHVFTTASATTTSSNTSTGTDDRIWVWKDVPGELAIAHQSDCWGWRQIPEWSFYAEEVACYNLDISNTITGESVKVGFEVISSTTVDNMRQQIAHNFPGGPISVEYIKLLTEPAAGGSARTLLGTEFAHDIIKDGKFLHQNFFIASVRILILIHFGWRATENCSLVVFWEGPLVNVRPEFIVPEHLSITGHLMVFNTPSVSEFEYL
jgi:hypothetical protein